MNEGRPGGRSADLSTGSSRVAERGVTFPMKKGGVFPRPDTHELHKHLLPNQLHKDSLRTSENQPVINSVRPVSRCQTIACADIAGIGGNGVIGARSK